MNDLHTLAQVPSGTFLIGSHGAERARVTTWGLDRDVVQLTDEQADRLASLGAEAARIARGRDGVWVETKPTAVVVHTRLAEESDAQPAEQEAIALGEKLGSGVLHGKDVVEISVLTASKGEALTALRDELAAPVVLYGATTSPTSTRSRRSGRRRDRQGGAGRAAARFHVDSPEEMVAALAALADAL